jgi:hypothetical protein
LSHGAATPAFVAAVGTAAGLPCDALAAVAAQMPESDKRRIALSMAQSFEKTYGKPPSQFAIDGYVAVKLVAARDQERAATIRGDPGPLDKLRSSRRREISLFAERPLRAAGRRCRDHRDPRRDIRAHRLVEVADDGSAAR